MKNKNFQILENGISLPLSVKFISETEKIQEIRQHITERFQHSPFDEKRHIKIGWKIYLSNTLDFKIRALLDHFFK